MFKVHAQRKWSTCRNAGRLQESVLRVLFSASAVLARSSKVRMRF